MSRIGRMPIAIPAGVKVNIDGNVVTAENGKVKLTQKIDASIKVEIKDGHIVLTRDSDDKEIRSLHGLYRALINNMVTGLHTGFSKSLIVNGVGWKAAVTGNTLVLNIGYSHPIKYQAPEGITLECPTVTEIVVKGYDKELVGQTAADIKAFRRVELNPYHLYGLRYKDAEVLKKERKTTKK